MKYVPYLSIGGLAALLLLSMSACGGGAAAEPTPPAIHYGEDACELCGMIISEEPHAAAYVTRDGHGHVFDDIGDMVRAHLAEPAEVAAFFVHDYADKSWIRAETASYLLSQELHTPMGSGLAAFASAEKAQALADELGGEVLTFEQVLAHYRKMAFAIIMTEPIERQSPRHA